MEKNNGADADGYACTFRMAACGKEEKDSFCRGSGQFEMVPVCVQISQGAVESLAEL